MVLYKRKPIPPAPAPKVKDLNTKVWHIPQTGEYFDKYTDYLARLDFYNEKKFVCEVTGASNCSFFEALANEEKENSNVEQNFPEALREPVLRYIQFRTTPRLDNLVDEVYTHFKNDFYPGEIVILRDGLHDRVRAVIREKARFNEPIASATVRVAKRSRRSKGTTRNGAGNDVNDGNDTELLSDEDILPGMSPDDSDDDVVMAEIPREPSEEPEAEPVPAKPRSARKRRKSLKLKEAIADGSAEAGAEIEATDVTSEAGLGASNGRKRAKTSRGSGKLAETEEVGNAEDSEDAVNAGNPPPETGGPLSTRKRQGTRRSTLMQRPIFCKYRVCVLDTNEELTVDETQITRDRKLFTKWHLRTFIKLTVSRDPRAGSPWLVKDSYARKYHIDQELPPELYKFKELLEEDERKRQRQMDRERKREEKEAQRARRGRGRDERTPRAAGKPKSTSKLELDDLLNRRSSDSPTEPVLPAPEGVNLYTDTPNRHNFYDKAVPSIREDLSFGYDYTRVPVVRGKPGQENDHKEGPTGSGKPQMRPKPKLTAAPFKNLPGFDTVTVLLQTWEFINVYKTPLVIDNFSFDDYLEALKFNSVDEECVLLEELYCALLNCVGGENEGQNALAHFIPRSLFESESKRLEYDEEEETAEPGEPGETREFNEKSETPGVEGESVDSESKSNGTAHVKKEPEHLDIKAEDTKSSEQPEEVKSEQQEGVNGTGSVSGSEESESEADDSEAESEDTKSKIDAVLNYKYIPWSERLERKLFRDAGWLLVLCGVLHEVSYVDDWIPDIQTVFEILLPPDKPVAPAAIRERFLVALPVRLRLRIVQILCELLYNSPIIKTYMETCMEDALNVRKEKLENSKLYRQALEHIKAVQAERRAILKAVIDEEDAQLQAEAEAGSAAPAEPQKGRRERMRDAEAALMPTHTRLQEIAAEIKETETRAAELERIGKTHDRRLKELDCQRLKLLGQDRFYNRYWWFEMNGLKTAGGAAEEPEDGSDGEAETEKSEKSEKPRPESDEEELELDGGRSRKRKKRHIPVEDDEEADWAEAESPEDSSDSGEIAYDDAYLMGRLWVQGPSDEQRQVYLGISDDFVAEVRQASELEAVERGAAICGIPELQAKLAGAEEAVVREQLVKYDFATNNNYGGLPAGLLADFLTAKQRKALEELPVLTLSTDDWGYYDRPEQVDELIAWLNRYGTRESQLLKELSQVRDRVCLSMRARLKELEMADGGETDLEENTEEDVAKADEETEEKAESEEEETNMSIGQRSRLRRGRTPLGVNGDSMREKEGRDGERKSRSEEDKPRRSKRYQRAVQWINSAAIEKYGVMLCDYKMKNKKPRK